MAVEMDAPATRAASWIGSVYSTWASLPSRASEAGVGVLSMYCASIALALFAFAFVFRGGTQLFGAVNLTPVFLLAVVLCVGVHFWATREIRFQLIWADVALIGFALLMLANSSSIAAMEKGLRFVALVLAPYFLARVILVDFVRLKLFLAVILAAATVLGIGVVAFLTLPDALANMLPYEITEWNQRMVFLKVNPVQFGMFLMVGAMLYTGLASAWRRIWMVPSLAIIGALLYDMLNVGTRASLVAVLGAVLAAFSIALITRRFSNFPVLLIVLGATGFLFYTVFAAALAPSTTVAQPGEARIRDDTGLWLDDEQKRAGEFVAAYLVTDKLHRRDDDPMDRWHWQRATALSDDPSMPDNATWTDIDRSGRISETYEYTLTEDDIGKFLRAYVSYEKEGDNYRAQTIAIGPIAPASGQLTTSAAAQQTTPAPAAASEDAQPAAASEDAQPAAVSEDAQPAAASEEAQPAAVSEEAQEYTPPGITLPQTGVTLPNQERLQTLALVVKPSDEDDKETAKLRGHVIQNRLDLLQGALTKLRANPLLGAGVVGMDDYAHNIFAETAADMGLIGLALLLAVFAFALRSLWKFFVKLDEKNPHFHIVTTVFLVASALFIQKQFSTSLPHHKDLIVFLAIIFNLPLLLGMPSPEVSGGIREKLPPRLRFLVPGKDSVPLDDAKIRP